MPLQPCHQLAKDLKAAIDDRILGRNVQSAGHKGRSVAYAERSTNELIAYYNQIRKSCPDALGDAELIELKPLDQPTVTRGRPAVRMGRSWV